MKTDLTVEIEQALIKRARRKSERYGLEVRVPNGICDFVTSKLCFMNHSIPHITCYEIKVSLNDYLYSENGANFVGDENYYVMPQELWDTIKDTEKVFKIQNKGLIIYKGGKLYKKTDGTNRIKRLTLEDKLLIMDTLLMQALYYGTKEIEDEKQN